MSHLLKKAVFILNFTFLVLSYSFAALHSDIDIIASGNGDFNYRWHNNGTLLFVCNNADQADASDSSLEARSFGYGTLSGFISGVLAPVIITRCLEPCLNNCCPVVSRTVGNLFACCRRQSSEDMDIRVDLLRTPIPEEYGFPLRALDSALSAEDSGWNKYALVDDDRHVVGYEYVLDDKDKGRASITLVKAYKGIENRKGLLIANKTLPLEHIRAVKEIEIVKERQLKKNVHIYQKKSETKVSSSSGSVVHAKNAKSSKKKISPAAGEKDGKSEVRGEGKQERETEDVLLQSFRQSFSSCTSENVSHLVNKMLSLYLKPGARSQTEN